MLDTRWHIKIEPLLKGDEFGYIATMENEERFDKMGWKEQGIFQQMRCLFFSAVEV